MRALVLHLISILSVTAFGLGGAACGEVPDMRPAIMQDVATHIFNGKVARIYSFVDRSAPNAEMSHCIVELQVTKVEKGEHKEPLAYVRYWQKRPTRGISQPDSAGHHSIPSVGAETRVFVLRVDDGGYDVLLPNGFALVEKLK